MAKWPKSTVFVATADSLVTTHPAWLHSLLLLPSAAGGDASVYEGQDTTSGRLLATLKGDANVSRSFSFDPPVWCERGIFVDIGTSVTSLTVHYTPQSLNRPMGDE